MQWGPVSGHMAQHIVLMNVVAPFVVLLALHLLPRATPRMLALATLLQLGLIWFWHAPPVLGSLGHHGLMHVVMQSSLTASALLFWWSVLCLRDTGQWRAIIALLITSKLFCLLGVLLTFSPRQLFGIPSGTEAAMADQQLAGLLMLVACPATYLVAGVILAARWIGVLDAQPPRAATLRS